MRNYKFKEGDTVKHKDPEVNETLQMYILEVDDSKALCRTIDNSECWYDFKDLKLAKEVQID